MIASSRIFWTSARGNFLSDTYWIFDVVSSGAPQLSADEAFSWPLISLWRIWPPRICITQPHPQKKNKLELFILSSQNYP